MNRVVFGVLLIVFASPATAEVRELTDTEKADARAMLGEMLRDAESARYKFPPIDTSKQTYCFQVNAKNGYGGYSGFQTECVGYLDVLGQVKFSGVPQ